MTPSFEECVALWVTLILKSLILQQTQQMLLDTPQFCNPRKGFSGENKQNKAWGKPQEFFSSTFSYGQRAVYKFIRKYLIFPAKINKAGHTYTNAKRPLKQI